MNELTSPQYWENKYTGAAALDIDPRDFRQRPTRVLLEKLESLGLHGKKVLEIGAGGSVLLTHLAARNPGADFHGLDYSEAGCRSLEDLARRRGAAVKTHHADLFSPPETLKARFDLVYSLGVAEHFESLTAVIRSQADFLVTGGLMLTVVPNLSGAIGRLTRRYAPAIMAMPKVSDVPELRPAHAEAGLEPLSAGYLCSTNFGVLSACFKSKNDRGWSAYLWLSRLSKIVWFFEDKLFPLPTTRTLSPYLYVIARAGGTPGRIGA
jgi:2-polyprenyl-3-methyl-5-hydroxy-6-metoxy-1,4-benzoquinol methylase